jgi:hypothetical protein
MSRVDSEWEALAARLRAPVLIVSTIVGRGMYTLGAALRERLASCGPTHHIAIEDYLPPGAVAEDVRRYKFIADRFPALLYVIYKVPIFYYRKYLRELVWKTDLRALTSAIDGFKPRTVVCVSHRPGFWLSTLRMREQIDFSLWGLLGEYGNTLGWRYIFWKEMDGFLSPIERGELTYPFPDRLEFVKITLPARREYYELAEHPGDPRGVLLVCGYWGQGPIARVLHTLLADDPEVRVIAVCGENRRAYEAVARAFRRRDVRIHGVVESLRPFMAECSSVVTKPGISTLLEARAAGRKIFLLKGMPVAEENNARYALQHFGAEWFTKEGLRRWQRSRGHEAASSGIGPIVSAPSMTAEPKSRQRH